MAGCQEKRKVCNLLIKCSDGVTFVGLEEESACVLTSSHSFF